MDTEIADTKTVAGKVRQFFKESALGDAASLRDTWTIATHNSMIAAAEAISRITGNSSSLPTKKDVSEAMSETTGAVTVPEATGPFTFGSNGDVFSAGAAGAMA